MKNTGKTIGRHILCLVLGLNDASAAYILYVVIFLVNLPELSFRTKESYPYWLVQ